MLYTYGNNISKPPVPFHLCNKALSSGSPSTTGWSLSHKLSRLSTYLLIDSTRYLGYVNWEVSTQVTKLVNLRNKFVETYEIIHKTFVSPGWIQYMVVGILPPSGEFRLLASDGDGDLTVIRVLMISYFIEIQIYCTETYHLSNQSSAVGWDDF